MDLSALFRHRHGLETSYLLVHTINLILVDILFTLPLYCVSQKMLNPGCLLFLCSNILSKLACCLHSHSCNRPSFCSGSCDEWHATMNFPKQNIHNTPLIKLVIPWTFLKTVLDTLETLKKHWEFSWNNLETYSEDLETSLKHLWNFHETSLKRHRFTIETPWNFLEIFLKPSWNLF